MPVRLLALMPMAWFLRVLQALAIGFYAMFSLFWLYERREVKRRERVGWWVEALSIDQMRAGNDDWAVVYHEGEAMLWLRGKWPHKGKPRLFVPSPERWADVVPAWAGGKRDVIVARVRQHLNPAHYDIQEQ